MEKHDISFLVTEKSNDEKFLIPNCQQEIPSALHFLIHQTSKLNKGSLDGLVLFPFFLDIIHYSIH